MNPVQIRLLLLGHRWQRRHYDRWPLGFDDGLGSDRCEVLAHLLSGDGGSGHLDFGGGDDGVPRESYVLSDAHVGVGNSVH